MIIIPIIFNFRGILGVCILLTCFFCYYVIYMDSKGKQDYSSVTGTIISVSDKYGEMPYRHAGKFRYILIDNYQLPFEIFVGKDKGDFKPTLERIDSLKPGDVITVYGYEPGESKREGVNRNAKFIDRGNISFFEKGSSMAIMGAFLLSCPIGVVIICFVMYKKGKMQF